MLSQPPYTAFTLAHRLLTLLAGTTTPLTILGTGRPEMNRSTRKPFVVPQIKEQASLAKVTLISGGKGEKHGHNNNNNTSNYHGHGHNS
jgi:hypothetical protein